MTIELAILLPTVSCAVALLSLIFVTHRNTRLDLKADEKERKEEAESRTMIIVKLEGMQEDLREIKEEIKAINDRIKDHDKEIAELDRRLTRVEASSAAAHHRIDKNFGRDEDGIDG